MKISTILARCLAAKGKLVLKEIGTIYNTLPSDVDKDHLSDVNGLYFEYNPKTMMSEELVDFVSKQSGKMKSLAQADLESYFENGRQLINIGKPFIIEGVGAVLKRQDGSYFLSDNFFNPLTETEDNKNSFKHGSSGAELNYDDYKYAGNVTSVSGKKTIIIIGGLLIIALISWGIYKLINYNNNASETVQLTEPVADSNATVAVTDTTHITKADSTAVNKDTIAAPTFYKVILFDTNNRKFALQSIDWFQKHNYPLLMETADSIRYKIYFRYDAPFSDSMKIRDSIERKYKRTVRIEH